jgi:hypothetical protein
MKLAAWWAVGIALCIALLMLITQTLEARALLMLLARLSSSKPTLAIAEQSKSTQQPIVSPDAHHTLNLVLEEEIDRPWKMNDPQVNRQDLYVFWDSVSFDHTKTSHYACVLHITTSAQLLTLLLLLLCIQVCVLVSTYTKHGLRLTALIASLLAISYPFIDIILLDTDVKSNSTQWMTDTANTFNSRSNDPKKRKTVHLSQYTQRYIQERFPAVTVKDYG